MKKKYVLGSVLVALLMLISSIAVVNTVISDPTQHTGDADAGSISINELDVSSVVTEFDDMAICHTIAEDDWVLWTEGTGNITVDWEVDIDSTDHPEYYIVYTLFVYNINDSNVEIGNDTFSKSYVADRTYDESGTLTANIEFSQSFMNSTDEATLLCQLGATAQLNSSEEAINFTSIAQDRAIVGVCFDNEGSEQPFSRFVDDANDNWPAMWSWMGGWNESSRFDDEDDMLNTQTFCKVGSQTFGTQGSGTWNMGDFEVIRGADGDLHSDYDQGSNPYLLAPGNNGELNIEVEIDLEVFNAPNPPSYLITRYQLFHEGGGIANRFFLEDWDEDVDPNPKAIKSKIYANEANDVAPVDGKVRIWGWMWATDLRKGTCRPFIPVSQIEIDEGTGSSSGTLIQSNYYWEESCAYENGTYDTDVDSSKSLGITTVDVNITEALEATSEKEYVYTFRGDRGDTRLNIKV
ncbi:MAG: hypothetical protein KKC68_02020 [Candidatus Thermoplasmatota archaeon]|nr:hypothetical protein [Candidatus Thermoplasmatota archaeon]MBU1940526.1 hypothetical protein [Candidatus Thermoplasmatota archaeon]